jgi:glycosyltransferase involved in cell wall biosynthesis
VLLSQWHHDGAVTAWLVPHNPAAPRPLRWLQSVKYLRTLVTEACYVPRLIRELRNADVVHVFSASYLSFLLAPLPALIVGRLLGRPVILNYHSGEAPDHLKRSRIARWALGRATRIAVPSRFLSDVFAAFGFKTTVVPNTLPAGRFTYRVRDPLRPALLSTRNFEPNYDVASTLRAFALVQQRYPAARLTLIGDGSERERLSELALGLRLHNVTFLGRVAPERICDEYAAHDVYVQTPTIDNMPISMLEAFASGLPVVSTRAGGVPTILRDRVDGLLAPVNDERTVAACILEMLDEPDRARHMAASAHATLGAYEWRHVRERWLDLYEAVVPRPAATADPVRA